MCQSNEVWGNFSGINIFDDKLCVSITRLFNFQTTVLKNKQVLLLNILVGPTLSLLFCIVSLKIRVSNYIYITIKQ